VDQSCHHASGAGTQRIAQFAARGLMLAEALVMGKVLCVFPNSVGGHVETSGEWSAPFWRGGGFAPVVGDFGGLAVLQFGDADVSVEASIAVIARPFDDDDVVEVKSPTDFQGELGEVAFDLRDEIAARYDFSHLGPLALAIRRERHPEDVGQAGLAVGRC
jgi:hypothetical protein